MKARFANGPYDHVTMHVGEAYDHIHLNVVVLTHNPAVDPPIEFHCQARYRLIMKNDYEALYQFEGIKK